MNDKWIVNQARYTCILSLNAIDGSLPLATHIATVDWEISLLKWVCGGG